HEERHLHAVIVDLHVAAGAFRLQITFGAVEPALRDEREVTVVDVTDLVMLVGRCLLGELEQLRGLSRVHGSLRGLHFGGRWTARDDDRRRQRQTSHGATLARVTVAPWPSSPGCVRWSREDRAGSAPPSHTSSRRAARISY